jgi:MFS transporter, OPA family, glycerol-3-phosphate transporter
MSSRARRRTLVWVIAIELVVGALIWFGDTGSSAAQPSTPAPTLDSAPKPAPSAKPKCPPPPTAWNKISRVSHKDLGNGTIVSSEGVGDDATVVVAFADGEQTVKGKTLKSRKKDLIDDLIPIAILLIVITIVVIRLPKIELGHTRAFRKRRLLNWLPLGLSYSFLYFGRYNIKQFQFGGDARLPGGEELSGLTSSEYGLVFGVGSAVYGLAFLLNGPLTDRWGGRKTILIATLGSGIANAAMGYMAYTRSTFGLSPVVAFSLLFAVNMYFQSFGAVSIVKVNAAWFHLRERGTFGGIFGILISLGIYFAYDIGKKINQVTIDGPTDTAHWLFWIPAVILVVFFVLSYLFVQNQPSDAGHPDFDLGDATSSGERLSVGKVFIKLLTHPVILVISIIELCSGFLRQAIMQWGVDFGRAIDIDNTFVFENWGMVLCIAGITGGMFAGAVSDHFFQSRRSPVSGVLYAIMLAGAIAIVPLFSAPSMIGWVVAIMSMAVIGVHGMLTATASADFAGKANTGVAVGLIDGFVYVGSTIQSFVYGALLPSSKVADVDGCMVINPEAGKVENWSVWPYAMIPVAFLGFVLTLRIWNAKPTRGGAGH